MRALVPLLLMSSGCTVAAISPETCSVDAACRDAFGLGWTCGDDGYCAEPALPDRCEAHPADLFDRADDPVVIGSLFDHGEDTPEMKAVRLAVTQATAAGGLDGRDFAVVECTIGAADDGLDLLDATEAMAGYLAGTLGVPAIVGPSSSAQTAVAYQAAHGAGTLVISPSATSPSLTPLDGLVSTDATPGLLWRTAPPDDLQGARIAEDMIARGVDHAGVIFANDAYGEGLSSVFLADFVGDGRTANTFPFTDTLQRDQAIEDAGVSESIDEVLFISAQIDDNIGFLNGAAPFSGYADKGFFLADGAADDDLLDGTTAAADLWPRVRGTRPAPPTDRLVYQAFESSYAAAYSGESARASAYTAFAYDAAWLVMYGAAWAAAQEPDGVTGTGIARGLRQVSSGPEYEVRPGSWTSVVAHLSDGQSVDVTGASGELDFDPETAETSVPIEIWTISEDGELVVEDR